MNTDTLRDQIEDLPTAPGVYIFYQGEEFLYVGKAVNVRDRVRSYLQPRSERIATMVDHADSLEARTATDESEALLLEANLIKKHAPQYNVRLKDGKSYPVIEVTDRRFPQITATRDPDERSRIYGPFTAMSRVQTVIKAISDIYGVRSHSDAAFERYRQKGRPCMDYQIGLCSAPCAGKITEEQYQERLEKAITFLEGDSQGMIEQIEEGMDVAVEEKRFERAATLRDYLENIEALRGSTQYREDGLTHAINISPNLERVGVVTVEGATITRKERYTLTAEAENQQEALAAFITQFYAADTLPETILVPQDLDDEELVGWLEGEGVTVTYNTDPRASVLLDAAFNAATAAEDDRMAALAADLEMDIERIECFDVSHTGGTRVVGANIAFNADGPVTDHYRRKKLREENDDYRNMYELVKWRAARSTDGRDDRPDPDVLLIDGGKGQLKAAVKAMKETDWAKPVLGIVKPDDDIVTLHGNPDISDAARNLLSAARDEAHRFAITYQRTRRDSIESVLEDIDGIGPKTAQTLLAHFDSLDAVKTATIEELCAVDGIGKHTARQIREVFGVKT